LRTLPNSGSEFTECGFSSGEFAPLGFNQMDLIFNNKKAKLQNMGNYLLAFHITMLNGN